MIYAKLKPELRRILWAEFAKASSIITNQTCNTVHDVPPDEVFYQKPCKLKDNMQILGRVGYLSKQSKIKTAKFVTDKANKVIMCGYAESHAKDTYRLLKVDMKSVVQTRNIRWAAWKPSEPGDGVHIKVKEYQDEGIEESDTCRNRARSRRLSLSQTRQTK